MCVAVCVCICVFVSALPSALQQLDTDSGTHVRACAIVCLFNDYVLLAACMQLDTPIRYAHVFVHRSVCLCAYVCVLCMCVGMYVCVSMRVHVSLRA